MNWYTKQQNARPMTTSRHSAAIKEDANRPKKFYYDTYQSIEDSSGESEEKNNNDTSQTLWTGISCFTKFESSSGHKTVLNCAMLYLVALMMTGSKFLDDPKNDQINLWPEWKPMTLDKTMVAVWNKWALKIRRKKGRRDRDIADRLTIFEACRLSTWSCKCYT